MRSGSSHSLSAAGPARQAHSLRREDERLRGVVDDERPTPSDTRCTSPPLNGLIEEARLEFDLHEVFGQADFSRECLTSLLNQIVGTGVSRRVMDQ